jgi:hypothetical protein
LIVIGAGVALSLPTVRHIISSLWNTPNRLPALSTSSQVHYEREVAALLPDAITRVEALHGRLAMTTFTPWRAKAPAEARSRDANVMGAGQTHRT